MSADLPDLCPDCHATAGFREVLPGVFALTVAHDDTCPALAEMESRRA